MAWVKRNLIFVIIIAVGVLATGYCGYLLYAAVGANSGVSSDYASTLDQLKTLQDAKPPATKENIQAAKDDQERVQKFLADFGKSFAPFPVARKVDDREFVDVLQLTLRRFAAEATNAGVVLTPDFAFSFSQERQKVSFAPECIDGWMQEMEELNVILNILFTAKINYLEQIQRVPVCQDDNSDDCLQTLSVSNQWGVLTPYKLTFRGFSTELAAVLSGFADSSNCFLVKYVNVTPSHAQLPQVIEQQPEPQQRYIPQPQYHPYLEEGGEGGRRRGGGRIPYRQAAPQMMIAAPAGPAPPETILQETPLYITLVVDVVKLKMAGH